MFEEKRDIMTDILLFIAFTISFLYCCDAPAICNIDFFVHNNILIYNVCLSLIGAYIFYVIQTLPSFLKRKTKYNKYIHVKLAEIETYMSDTIYIFAKEHFVSDYEKIKRKIENNIQNIDIFSEGTYVVRNKKEIVIIDFLMENEKKIHNEILELISLNILGKRTVDLLLEIEQLELRNFAENYAINRPGAYLTRKQKEIEQPQGEVIYNDEYIKGELIKIMETYIDTYKRVVNYRNSLTNGLMWIINDIRL
ncbi:MAG: hypothetical protein E7419_02945 [Ruminococcaceae bacterium]|nr:hypothetical protein [Oscillospiraceae bacterium]